MLTCWIFTCIGIIVYYMENFTETLLTVVWISAFCGGICPTAKNHHTLLASSSLPARCAHIRLHYVHTSVCLRDVHTFCDVHRCAYYFYKILLKLSLKPVVDCVLVESTVFFSDPSSPRLRNVIVYARLRLREVVVVNRRACAFFRCRCLFGCKAMCIMFSLLHDLFWLCFRKDS